MKNTLTSLRLLAAGRLMQYRKYRHFLKQQRINVQAAAAPSSRENLHAVRRANPSAREMKQMRGWVRAIDRVRNKLLSESPEKADFMNRCFGLDTVLPSNSSSRARIIELSIDMHIAESTAYKWRECILDLVLFAAIEAGVLMPFGTEDDTSAPS